MDILDSNQFRFLLCHWLNWFPFWGIAPACNCRVKEYCEDKNSAYCPKEEIFINGGSLCDITCADLNKTCIIRSITRANGCYCPRKFARLSNGNCALISSTRCRREYDASTSVSVTPYRQANCEPGPTGNCRQPSTKQSHSSIRMNFSRIFVKKCHVLLFNSECLQIQNRVHVQKV